MQVDPVAGCKRWGRSDNKAHTPAADGLSQKKKTNKVSKAHERLQRAYNKAHKDANKAVAAPNVDSSDDARHKKGVIEMLTSTGWLSEFHKVNGSSLFLGFCLGICVSTAMIGRK